MSDSSRGSGRWLTLRAIALGVALMPLLVAWNYHIEVVFYCFATYAAPFFNVVVFLFVLALANQGLLRWAPRLALNGGELLVVYAMLSLQGALCSHNMMEILITMLPHPWRFARPENNWAQLFIQRLPQWALISDPRVFEDYYLGNSTFWTAEHLRGWVRPAFVWSSFTTVLLLTMLCLTHVLRRRWIEHERLSYPVLQLPLALVQRPGELFGQRMLWAGFATAGLLSLVAGLHEIVPAVPDVPIGRHGMDAYFGVPPWTALRGMRWAIYPWAIGIAFLMPLDLSISCSVFYFLYCAERVFGSYTGLSRAGGFPWAYDQAFGAYLGLLVMGLWVGRDHFGRVLRTAWHWWHAPLDDDDRAYRRAVWGAVLGIAALVWFACELGMTWVVALLFFLLYFALATTITRIRAEMGFPTHDMHEMAPPQTFVRLLTPQAFGAGNLVGFTCLFWFNRTYASHPMPHLLEGYKMSAELRDSGRRLTWGLVVAAVVAPWFVFLIVPHFYYRYGSATGNVNIWGTQFGMQAWGMLEAWLKAPRRFDPAHWMASVAGFSIALLLGAARVRLIGWPLHPLSYAIANSWGVEQLWFCLILASTIKLLMLRYGGLPLYRRWIPFFLGLPLGDFVFGSFWNFVGIYFGFHPYDFWPGLIK